MSDVETNGDSLVRLWVVIEEDRGMGATVQSLHVSEEEANKECSGNRFVESVDIQWSHLESLKPNTVVMGAAQSAGPSTAQPACSASDVSAKYNELLYAVAQKFPGESRHETALRYISEREQRACEAGSCKQNASAHPRRDETLNKNETETA